MAGLSDEERRALDGGVEQLAGRLNESQATGTRNNKTGGSAADSSTLALGCYLPSSCSIRSAVGDSFENPQTTLPARSIRRYVGHDSTPYRVAVTHGQSRRGTTPSSPSGTRRACHSA